MGILSSTLSANHYRPIPLNGKIPAIKNWVSEVISKDQFKNKNIGIVCGTGDFPISAVDIDILDEVLAKKIRDYVFKQCGETLVRVGKAPKMMLIYRAEQEGFIKKQTKHTDSGKVEILGKGQQFAAFGTHPDTKQPYRWVGGKSINDVSAENLPVISEAQINSIINYASNLMEVEVEATSFEDNERYYDPNDPLCAKLPHTDINTKEIEKLLTMLDPDSDRKYWCNVGMALHHQYGGSYEGFLLWDDWSSKSSKYPGLEDLQYQWGSFGNFPGEPVTLSFIRKEAGEVIETVKELSQEPDFFGTLNWSLDRFSDNPPDIPMIVEDFLPKGIVSLLFSAGGAGKSTLQLALAAKIALANEVDNVDFFGHDVYGGKVVIVTAEDPDIILNKRFISIVDACADEFFLTRDEVRQILRKNLYIVSTFGHSAQLFKVAKDGNLETTVYYKSLYNNLQRIQDLSLVVIDTKTRYSPAEGLGNVTATQEITHYENIALNVNASVMLLHHTNKASRNGSQDGMQAYRDSTAIYDSVRAAWYLRGLTEDEKILEDISDTDHRTYMLLENSKNNYIAMHKPYIICRDGFKFTHKLQTPKNANPKRLQKDKEESIELLRYIQNGNNNMCMRELEQLSPFGRTKVNRYTEYLVEKGLITKLRKKRSIVCCLTEEGEKYGLSLEDSSWEEFL